MIRHCLLLLLVLGTVSWAQTAPSYVPHRVFDAKEKRFTDFETMLADLSRADVVFIGEQHDDPGTHRLEIAILEGIARRRTNVVVALEMFERDVQKQVSDYMSGRISEQEFLKDSRPWPRYATDYRPIVEFAKAKGWQVIAGNVPRRYASQVARTGLSAAEKLPANERGFLAREFACPQDDYYKRFAETMTGHPDDKGNSPKMDAEMVGKMFLAQCVKDETMAESVANARIQNPQALVIHYNGSFHSDYRLGTAARVARRLKDAKIKIVSALPVADLDNVGNDKDRKRGDYLIYTLQPPKSQGSK